MADDVIRVLSTIIPVGTVVRWARTSKVPDLQLMARVETYTWHYTSRNGGGFNIILSFGDILAPHSRILREMHKQFISYVKTCVYNKVPPVNKRRKELKVPLSTTTNSSRDLHFNVNGKWMTFGELLPNEVRMLKQPYTSLWIQQNRKSMQLSALPLPPSIPHSSPQISCVSRCDIFHDIDMTCVSCAHTNKNFGVIPPEIIVTSLDEDVIPDCFIHN